MFYSKITGGFYTSEIHGDSIPADAKEIPEDLYIALMEAQASGKKIEPGECGFPVAVDYPAATTQDLNAAIDRMRASTYRDEADPLFFKAQRGEVEQQVWLDKIAEIKARYTKDEA